MLKVESCLAYPRMRSRLLWELLPVITHVYAVSTFGDPFGSPGPSIFFLILRHPRVVGRDHESLSPTVVFDDDLIGVTLYLGGWRRTSIILHRRRCILGLGVSIRCPSVLAAYISFLRGVFMYSKNTCRTTRCRSLGRGRLQRPNCRRYLSSVPCRRWRECAVVPSIRNRSEVCR